ncbi:hypothetical protein [Aegicerativicinus sediminis]
MSHFKFILTLILLNVPVLIYAQNSCKVLLKNIEGKYEGDCKNGLANGFGKSQGIDYYEGNFKKGEPSGFGIMVYNDGSKYIGEWKNGLKHGAGKFEFTVQKKDTVTEGYWKKGDFIGDKKSSSEKTYKIVRNEGVHRYSFRKIGDAINQVTIVINNNGIPARSPQNIYANSGSQFNTPGRIGFTNIEEYPFTCSMRYNMPTKLGASNYQVQFEFNIYQKGEWIVELFH